MDLKDSKTQKIAMAALAFFIVVYFWYSRVYSINDNQIALKQQEFETITTNLKNVELKAKTLDGLKVEYADLIGRYHEIEALLPEVKQIPSFLVQLHTASSLTGTRIKRIMPMPLESQSFYNVTSFEVEMTGTYHDFGRFISYVANFPFITNVKDMDIKALKVSIGENESASNDGDSSTKNETMSATFTLSTYFVKEEERLQELTL